MKSHSLLLATLCVALAACSRSYVAPHGWKTYAHIRYNYQLSYPPSADIEESPGGTFSNDMKKDVPFPDATCVTIREAFGTIAISASDDPGNSGDPGIYCGLMNIQTLGGKSETKNLISEGQSVEAKGYVNPAFVDRDDRHNLQTEWLTFLSPSGFRVVYRLDPQTDADLARYEEIKTELETIAQSIRAK